MAEVAQTPAEVQARQITYCGGKSPFLGAHEQQHMQVIIWIIDVNFMLGFIVCTLPPEVRKVFLFLSMDLVLPPE